MGNKVTFHYKNQDINTTYEGYLDLYEDKSFKYQIKEHYSYQTYVITVHEETSEIYTGTYQFDQQKVILSPQMIERIKKNFGLSSLFGRWRKNGYFYIKEGEWYVNNDVYVCNEHSSKINYQQNVKVCSENKEFRIELKVKGNEFKDLKDLAQIELLQYFQVNDDYDFNLLVIDPKGDSRKMIQ